MKVSYVEGLANHNGPESCGAAREGGDEALTGERMGRVWSRESLKLRGADAVVMSGRPHRRRRQRETPQDPARSETPCTHGSTSHENREVPGPPTADGVVGRVGKSKGTRRR